MNYVNDLFLYATAMANLRPGAKFSFDDGSYEGMNWNDENPAPTREELEAEVNRLKNEQISTEYKRLRAKEYPDFKDYLDGVVKGDQAQIQAYIDACLAVKDKYPKP